MHQRHPRISLTMTAIFASMIGFGCRKPAPEAPPAETAPDVVSNESKEEPSPSSAKKSKVEIKPEVPSPALTEETFASLRSRIQSSDHYPDRIEARRTLMHRLCEDDKVDVALSEFRALLDDVEAHEDRSMAVRVAFSDAGTWMHREDHEAAIGAYGILLARYGDSDFACEALMHMGSCHLELREYAEAEQVWRRLIEEYDGTPMTPWGWRKLALAQVLQGRYDASLSTLAMMAKKYEGTHFGEYAQVRQGYVLMAANRLGEAKSRYDKFLATCSQSKYCRLAERQLVQLEEAMTLARANGKQR